MVKLSIDNTYLTLPEDMYQTIETVPYPNVSLELLNSDLLDELGIDIEDVYTKEGLSFLSGTGKDLKFAQAYAGHQFGYFTMLGDGRAVMLGELITPQKKRYDLQLKGSGMTNYSRRGDGKATLISTLREYLISEAMYRLNVPTSRSLAVFETGSPVRREVMHKGAMVLRVASSHIRVGTFQFAASKGKDYVKELADYTIKRHYRKLMDKDDKYRLLLQEVIKKQASLIAKWVSKGFVHGVMNTDNVLVSGETIDYGPCAFINQYKPDQVYSSIDVNGRYAYLNQPYIGSWNMARFAETLLPILSDNHEEALDIANTELSSFEQYYKKSHTTEFMLKLGVKNIKTGDDQLVKNLLDILEKENADLTNTFKILTKRRYDKLRFGKQSSFLTWLESYYQRIQGIDEMEIEYLMKQNNPVIIPRNNVVQKALEEAAFNNNYNLFDELYELYKEPYDYTKIIKENYLEDTGELFTSYCGT